MERMSASLLLVDNIILVLLLTEKSVSCQCEITCLSKTHVWTGPLQILCKIMYTETSNPFNEPDVLLNLPIP
jgi:hypothetical protein